MDGTQPEAKRLRHDVEWALRRALDPATVLPMLHRLSRLAADGTDESVYAQRRLAELLAEHHPWRAALAARRVLAAQPTDDGAWAILALCHALLGNFRCAVRSYRRAVDLAPTNAAYAHNLGHILDVARNCPNDAVPWLRAAYDLSGSRPDVAVSLAHALGRAGRLAEAKRVSRKALRAGDPAYMREHVALAKWLEAGAPEKLLPERPLGPGARAPWREPSRFRGSRRGADDVDVVLSTLARGLANLPLDASQRARARGLARDPTVAVLMADERPGAASPSSVAAAIAYAIVHVDHVPLTQAEVAASFRVSASALRGQWKALRAAVDLRDHVKARATADRPR